MAWAFLVSIFLLSVTIFYKTLRFYKSISTTIRASLLSIFLFVSVFSQAQSDINAFLKPSDTLNKPRRTGVYVGESVLRLSGGSERIYELIQTGASLSQWLDFIWTEAPMAMVQGLAGLAIISIIAAAIGYVIAAGVWRLRITRKWRRRSKSHAIGG